MPGFRGSIAITIVWLSLIVLLPLSTLVVILGPSGCGKTTLLRIVVEQAGSPNELFKSPKTEFVMNFLGEVNVFRGENSRTLVRPHDFRIAREPRDGGVSAHVVRVLTAGSVVKIELADDRGERLFVHMSHAEYGGNPVKLDERVWLQPTSQRIFKDGDAEDYVI